MQLRFRRALSALMAVVLLTSAPALALGFIFGEDAVSYTHLMGVATVLPAPPCSTTTATA